MTWNKDGLHFECQRSGNCCTGEPGYVWLKEEECQRIAARIGVDFDDFLENCTRLINGKRCLVEFENGDCIFYDKGCNIYADRPSQCRTWPFWDSILNSKESWERASRECPGINKGKVHSFEEIEKYRKINPGL